MARALCCVLIVFSELSQARDGLQSTWPRLLESCCVLGDGTLGELVGFARIVAERLVVVRPGQLFGPRVVERSQGLLVACVGLAMSSRAEHQEVEDAVARFRSAQESLERDEDVFEDFGQDSSTQVWRRMFARFAERVREMGPDSQAVRLAEWLVEFGKRDPEAGG